MKCVKAGGMHPFSCGQCMPCRIDKKREWTSRMVLESKSHDVSSFITLTYTDESLPRDYSVSKREIQLWMKRLRKDYPDHVRYYAVGEYGDSTWRPHYHVALFGYPICQRGRTDRKRLKLGSCCPPCDLVFKTWGSGMIEVAPLTSESAGYICGYVTKKMTKPSDPRLRGLSPEFALMSRQPGLGALYMARIAFDILSNEIAYGMYMEQGTVPSNLKMDGKSLVLGRYLRNRLYEEFGFCPKTASKIRENIRYADLSAMWQGSSDYEKFTALKNADPRFVVHSQEEKRQKARNLETRVKMFNSKRSI